MSTTQHVVVRSNGADILRRFVTLRELGEFVAAAYAAGAQPEDRLHLGSGLQIEIPTPEERAQAGPYGWRQQ